MTETLGELLRRLRLDADLTLEALSERSGVSDRAISDIERGESLGPQRRTVELLADALEVDGGDREALFAAARVGRRRPPSDSGSRGPLPRPVSDFTGRGGEVAAVTARMTSAVGGRPAPVTVVCGPPGFGKTSLAVRVGTDAGPSFDAVHFLDLRGYDSRPLDAHGIITRLIHAVTGEERKVPGPLDEAASLWQTLLDGRRVLLVLDNAASEEQVRSAIPTYGPSAAIITGRGVLAGLEDVDRVFLDQLTPAESVALLHRIVPVAQTDGQDLERLAALCDHVPLALRIAGNRLVSRPSWTADDLSRRLETEDSRMDALRAGDLDVRRVIALSYDRLSPPAQQSFRRLALLHTSTFSDALAARSAPADLTTAEMVLDELTDLGLVHSAPQGRYHLHDLVRLYARERLHQDDTPEERAARETDLRHWLLHVTIDAGRWFEPGYETAPAVPDPLVDLSSIERAEAWLRVEVDHWFVALQEAAAASEHQLVVDVAESLHWFSDLWAHWGHWYDVYALAVDASRHLGDDEVLATQLGYRAWAELYTRDRPEAGLATAREAQEVARRAGSKVQEAWATYYAGWADLVLQRYDDALEDAIQARELMAAAGDPDGRLQAWRLVSNVLRLAGRPAAALANEQAVVAWLADPASGFSRQVARFTTVASFSEQALLRVDLEQWEEAVDAADEALRLVDQQEQTRARAIAHTARGSALAHLDRIDEARHDLEVALALSEMLGDAPRAGRVRQLLDDLPV